MELTYYSYYPYNDPNRKDVTVVDENGYENDLWGQPFRLYKAAVCRSLVDFQSEEDFVKACFEAMDCPEYRISDYESGKPYKDDLYGIEVTPTEHFYGATNSYDGVFVIKQRLGVNCYVNLLRGWKQEQSWYHAVTTIFRYHHDEYVTKLCDFS